MAREKVVNVEQHKVLVYSTKYKCDKCGRVIDDDDPPDDDSWLQVLEIYLNIDQCVNDRVKMDLCRKCLKPIWKKICAAIGADPGDELRIGQEDE